MDNSTLTMEAKAQIKLHFNPSKCQVQILQSEVIVFCNRQHAVNVTCIEPGTMQRQ